VVDCLGRQLVAGEIEALTGFLDLGDRGRLRWTHRIHYGVQEEPIRSQMKCCHDGTVNAAEVEVAGNGGMGLQAELEVALQR
jgi:hypothetical protein